jgi:predicted glycoside hydrolase/deacetylase ChbG (UPF0249 family)
MSGKRFLAVNADDFGFTRDVNFGIIEAHRNGILTSTTLMANGAAFDHAVELAARYPSLDVGVHFVLAGGASIAHPGTQLPASVTALLRALLAGRLNVYQELRAQMEKIVVAGVRPTHLDTHKHTHLLPAVLEAVARLGEQYGARWVRRPFDLPLHGAPSEAPWTKRCVSRSLRFLRSRFQSRLARHACRATDWFAGFQITGRVAAEDVIHLLRNLPPGYTEFMVHPGYCTEELLSARTRLKESRAAELRALTDPRVREALESSGVELLSFAEASQRL